MNGWISVTPVDGQRHIGTSGGRVEVAVNLTNVTHLFPLSDGRGTRIYFNSGADYTQHQHSLDVRESLDQLVPEDDS